MANVADEPQPSAFLMQRLCPKKTTPCRDAISSTYVKIDFDIFWQNVAGRVRYQTVVYIPV